jgi:hypothetical protein
MKHVLSCRHIILNLSGAMDPPPLNLVGALDLILKTILYTFIKHKRLTKTQKYTNLLIKKSECVSVCLSVSLFVGMYFKKKLYILLHNNTYIVRISGKNYIYFFHNNIYVFQEKPIYIVLRGTVIYIVAKQLKQWQSVSLETSY